jgi:hypothetical protein
MTTIKLKNGSGAPAGGDLVQGEPALDLTNKRLYTEDSGGTVIEVGTNPGVDVTFADNRKAIFGAGSDLQIYHNGSHNFIEGANAGNIYIRNQLDDGDIIIQSDDGSGGTANYIQADGSNGEVRLFHYGSEKLNTTSTGIDVTGVITTDGITTSANISFGDGDRAVFGASSDLQVFHDGSNSYIADNGTGDLFISGAANITFRKSGTSEVMAQFSQDGAASLYYDNTARLATTSTGIDVTGTATMDGLTVQTAQGDITIPTGTSSLNFDRAGTSYLRATDAAGNLSVITGANNFTTKRMDVLANGDIRFYDSAGSDPKLTWDASAESLGIGTSSPSRTLHIKDTVAGVRLEDSDDNSYGEILYNTGSNGLLIRSDEGNTDAGSNIIFEVDGTESARIDSSGNVGIGTSSISTSKLHLQGTTGTASAVRAESTAADSDAYYIADNDASVWTWGIDGGNGDAWTLSNAFGLGTPKLTVETDGSVGIGTDSPDDYTFNTGTTVAFEGATNSQLSIISATDGIGYLAFGDGTTGTDRYSGLLEYYHSDDSLRIRTAGYERMRIDSSGNLLVGTTSTTPSTGGFSFLTGAIDYAFFSHDSTVTSGNYYIGFRHGTNNLGAITQDGTTGVLYNTASDQRLKDNIIDAPSASDDIDAIQVRSFDWKADGSHQKYGMIAQELQTVVPDAVSESVTEEDMMGVDYSKLVPMLVKEIQSLRARVAQLETN